MHVQEVAQEHASWRKKWKCYVFAVYPQEHSKRKKLKTWPQEAARSYQYYRKLQEGTRSTVGPAEETCSARVSGRT